MSSKKSKKEQNGGVDGRRLRRERGRAAVIDALFELLLEGRPTPGSDELARRAGVSEASVFRYFDNLDDLYLRAFQAFQERYAPLLSIPKTGQGTRTERITAFVRARIHYYEMSAPILAAGRARAIHTGRPEMMSMGRQLRVDQVRGQFGVELAGVSTTRAADLVASIDTLAGAEAWDALRDHHARSREQIRRMWTRNIDAVITAWCDG